MNNKKTTKPFSGLQIIVLVLCLLFLGCNNDRPADNLQRAGIDPQSLRRADPQIQQSFEIVKVEETQSNTRSKRQLHLQTDPQLSGEDAILATKLETGLAVDQAHVVIQKSALGKEFLLSVNMLTQTPTPMFSALQSRIVSFIVRGNKVCLLDVTKNNVVAPDINIQQSLLIAEFPILKETKKTLEIDFNLGMSKILVASDMAASDDPKASSADSYQLPVLEVEMSYLDEVTFSNSALFIRQVVQAEYGGSLVPAEVRYQIKPYLPDLNFVPLKSPGLVKVGYFEANPLLLSDGSTRVYAMKWNEKKTIQFAISANTPIKYRELIKSALLYWNKILGDQAIEVVQLEDKTQTAPRFELNIFQWADWDAAGYAYADAHIDPRSGEVTSAQIFFPSAFMQPGIPNRLRLGESARAQRLPLGLKGFKSARLCKRNIMNDLAHREIYREKGEEVSPAAMDKAMRDYVYETVAHELGHVLGLRHNFAGSLAANYDYKDRKKMIMNYYKNMKAPEGVVASSSVMEYSKFEESSWNGDVLQNGGKALAYDAMAIQHLYFKTPLPVENRPVFCTDSDLELYADCNQSDAGQSVVSAASGAYEFNLNTLAARLINSYISQSKVPANLATDLIPVSEVNLRSNSIAKALGNDLAKLASLLKDGAGLIAVRSQYLPILDTMKIEIDKLEKDYLQSEFARLGGIETLLKEIPENFDTQLVEKFSELLDDPMYNSGVLPDGTKYSFTAGEMDTMKAQVVLFAPQIKEQFILHEIKVLSGESFAFEQYGQEASEAKQLWADSDLTQELSGILLKRFARYSLTKTSEKLSSEITLKDGEKKLVELPLYQYPQNIRLAATGLFLGKYKAIDGGFVAQKNAINLMKEELIPLGDPEQINLSALDRKTLQWIMNNTKILSTLSE